MIWDQFHYVATLDDGDFRENEIIAPSRSAPGRQDSGPLGQAPKIRFWEDKLVFIATTGGNVKWCGFPIGDVVTRLARPGDVIDVGSGDMLASGLGLSMFRSDQLIVALGNLVAAPLGQSVAVTACDPMGLPESRFEVSIGDDVRSLGTRESASVGGYDVYVEFAGDRGLDARGPILSMVRTEDITLINSARRSAILMHAGFFDPLRGERQDGTYIKAE